MTCYAIYTEIVCLRRLIYIYIELYKFNKIYYFSYFYYIYKPNGKEGLALLGNIIIINNRFYLKPE